MPQRLVPTTTAQRPPISDASTHMHPPAKKPQRLVLTVNGERPPFTKPARPPRLVLTVNGERPPFSKPARPPRLILTVNGRRPPFTNNNQNTNNADADAQRRAAQLAAQQQQQQQQQQHKHKTQCLAMHRELLASDAAYRLGRSAVLRWTRCGRAFESAAARDETQAAINRVFAAKAAKAAARSERSREARRAKREADDDAEDEAVVLQRKLAVIEGWKQREEARKARAGQAAALGLA